jgi:hypothetical protein
MARPDIVDYELRALDEVIKTHPNAVIATPGGLVSEPATLKFAFDALLYDLAPGDTGRPYEASYRAR